MQNSKSDEILVLAGHGYDEQGPYLLINHLHAKTQELFHVWNKTFSLTKSPRRFCTGWFDFSDNTTHACDNEQELMSDAKFSDCPICQEKTGFNPAFYNAETVSPQQAAYNATPHFVYMAYFAPDFLKVGISAEARGIDRLLEQGARACAVLGRFDTADQARELEAYLCSQPGIYETMRAGKKTELFAETAYDFNEAKEILHKRAEGFDIHPEHYWDFTPFYFGSLAPSYSNIHIPPNAPDDVCGGLCVGMVGTTLVFRQNGEHFPINFKDWKAHAIKVHPNKILTTYEASSQQMFLC